MDWTFHEYLLKRALPSYAKMFVSFQAMAQAVPGAVHIVAESALRADPARVLSSLLSHLKLDRWQTAQIEAVADLCRREHILVIERELGLSLTGSRGRRRRSTGAVQETVAKAARDPNLRWEALTSFASMGVNTAFFEEPPGAASLREDVVATGRV